MSVAPLPSVVSQNTIELHAIGHLRDLGSLRIVGILCRRDQLAEDQGGHRRNEAHGELYDVLGIRCKMMLGQNAAKKRPRIAPRKRHAKASQPISIGLDVQFSKV